MSGTNEMNDRFDDVGGSHVATPKGILDKVLSNPDIDRDGLRLSLWSGFYTGPVFAEIEKRFGLYRDENNVLFALATYGQLTAKSISEFLGRPKNSISRAIDRLLKKGLVHTEVDPADRRRVLLTIEPAGRELHEQTLAIHKAREAYMLKNLSPVERTALDAILAKLIEDADDWIEPF
ncbi:MarR family transcriptional regulator [Pelagibacterium flavum]|uniref:MarR family transcriptional regulator n=1 Tax=Pelagibacterium flavum TaxID=2984530 RepID=A0ABY6IRP5_9HYPH|nr:MarR family transcriptional regulator [Pelagibacterium sp. YIM 151497]MAN77073.1 MarR family transcriptional regulator [Hyphomicrobiales bacterium]UYQ71962.1 MarR family transcriptional regulator [Pelagibacterium sp. YIM 151497]|tara:strand:+ start:2900 stop:3433 length:534 start_codon:yes stop_codon:yes gene_type:complete